MSVEANNAKNNKNPSKFSKGCVKVKSFYSKHFPTDRKTYNLRIPFVGLILSILSVHFSTSFVGMRYYFQYGSNELVRYCYVFAAAGVAYELYYGFKIGDRKQYTPWIILKVLENLVTIIAFICGCALERRSSHDVPEIIYGIVVIIFNCGITFIVTDKSVRQFRGVPPKTVIDDNIYDNYDNV